MNNIIIHKIVTYLKNRRIAKLFFYFSDYHRLINTSNSHFDELYDLYGNKEWYKMTNNLRSVQSMLRLKILFNYNDIPMDIAAKNGHLEIVKWLESHYKQWQTIHENQKEGDRDICTKWAMNYAAANGHLETVKWLHENRNEGCTINAMNWAAHNGHLEVIKWLHENRKEGCTSYAMNWAAHNGHLEVIKWLHENRKEGCSAYAMNFAAENGHLEVVKWLHVNRKEGCTKWAMNHAAYNGHLEIIKWLYQNRTEGCTKEAMNWAAQNGNLEIVKWLEKMMHLQGTHDIYRSARELATIYGHLEVVNFFDGMEFFYCS
jgi:ankyrin repeat protein